MTLPDRILLAWWAFAALLIAWRMIDASPKLR